MGFRAMEAGSGMYGNFLVKLHTIIFQITYIQDLFDTFQDQSISQHNSPSQDSCSVCWDSGQSPSRLFPAPRWLLPAHPSSWHARSGCHHSASQCGWGCSENGCWGLSPHTAQQWSLGIPHQILSEAVAAGSTHISVRKEKKRKEKKRREKKRKDKTRLRLSASIYWEAQYCTGLPRTHICVLFTRAGAPSRGRALASAGFVIYAGNHQGSLVQ